MFGFFTWRWVLNLGFDHMFTSPVFLGLLILLACSLMACTYTTQIPLVKVARRSNSFEFAAEASTKHSDKSFYLLLYMQMVFQALCRSHSQARFCRLPSKSICQGSGNYFDGCRIWGNYRACFNTGLASDTHAIAICWNILKHYRVSWWSSKLLGLSISSLELTIVVEDFPCYQQLSHSNISSEWSLMNSSLF